MRGRKPKPTILHALEGTGNVTRHRARQFEPKPTGDLLAEPPSWMSESQQSGWRYIMQHAPKGVLKHIDYGVLAVYVEAQDRHRIATIGQAALDKGNSLPLLVKLKVGLPLPSPYLNVLNKAALVMLKAASELGFSPASRPRLSVDDLDEDENDPWTKLQVISGGRSND